MNRRSFVAAAAAAALRLGQAAPARAQPPAEAVRVGLLLPLSGPDAGFGRMIRDATMLGVEEVNRRLRRRPLMVFADDSGSDRKRFFEALRRLVVTDKVASLLCPVPPEWRADALAMVERNNALLWDPAPYEGGDCSPHVVHTGATPHQLLKQFVPWLVREAGPRVLLVGSDQPRARELARVSADVLRRIGATPVGEPVTVAAGEADWSGLLARLGAERVDVVFSTLAGAERVAFHRQRAARLDARLVPVASPMLDEVAVAAIGPDAAAGSVAVSCYFMSYGSPENRSFLERLRRRTGRGGVVTAVAEAAYFQVHLLGQAVENLGEGDLAPVNLREAAKERQIVAPQGTVRVDPESMHTLLSPKIAVVEPDGRFKLLAQAVDPLKPLPFWAFPDRACVDGGQVRREPPVSNSLAAHSSAAVIPERNTGE